MEHMLDHGAADLLRARDLTAHITQDLTALGYVGEAENKLLAYVVAVSRKLARPLGMVIQGPNTSGKSDLAEKVLSLCPDEDVFANTRVTAQSLYYVGLQDPFSLAHKIVAVEEAKGAEEANYAIRVLLTRGRLDLQTILHQTPVHIILHGPIAYLETTTEDLTNDEAANRVLQVRTDASEAQTQAILDAQRRRAATVVHPSDQVIIARHQAAQRLLQHTAVIIPFAEKIGFPTQHTRARRDHQRLLDLICAMAFLHQYQRPHGQAHGIDFIEASPDDYELAAQLMQRCLLCLR
jgi:DNA primase